MSEPFVWDTERHERLGFDEAVFCAGKSVAHIETVVERAVDAGRGMLLTRLDRDRYDALRADLKGRIDWDELSATGFLDHVVPEPSEQAVAIVTAGTSDLGPATEAVRTLAYYGVGATLFADLGVAALWRLSSRLEDIRRHRLCIVAAGMDAALPSVLGGLFRGPVVAVPTSVGYGIAAGGRTALDSMLASCAPGVTVCNIDNGYGAACAALRILGTVR